MSTYESQGGAFDNDCSATEGKQTVGGRQARAYEVDDEYVNSLDNTAKPSNGELVSTDRLAAPTLNEQTAANTGTQANSPDVFSASKHTAATSPTTFMDQPSVSPWSGTAFSVYNKIVALQHKFLTIQTDLNSERTTIKYRLDALRDSLATLAKFIGRSGDRQHDFIDPDAWREAVDYFTANRDRFESVLQRVSDLEQQLSDLEYILAKEHPKLLQIVDDGFKGVQSPLVEVATIAPPHSPEQNTPLHPLQEEFFEKRGETKLLRERLFNHGAPSTTSADQSLDDAEAVKEDAPGPEAEERLAKERQEIAQELSQAEQDLERLWHACQDNNLDVGSLSLELPAQSRLNGPPFEPIGQAEDDMEHDPPSFIPRDDQGRPPRLFQNIHWPERGRLLPPWLRDLTDFRGKREFIENWVDKLPRGWRPSPGRHGEHETVPEFDRTLSARRSDPERSAAERATDVAPSEDFVLIPVGGKVDPYCQPSLFKQVYKAAIRQWKSDDALRSTYYQDS